MRLVHVGVLGAGFIGQAHILALRQLPNVSIDLLVDHDPVKAEQKARYWNIPRWSTNWVDAVESEGIDVVHNCLPNNEHFSVILACIQRNKHLFTEKPLTSTLGEAQELEFVMDTVGNPIIGVNFNYRYYPMVRQMRERIMSGTIGTPLLMNAHYLQDWLVAPREGSWRLNPERVGPSRALADIGSHVLDLTEFMLDDRIVAVNAIHGGATRIKAYGPKSGAHGDDFAILMLEMERGTKGSITVSQVSPGHKNDLSVEIMGTTASLRWQQESPERLWKGRVGETNEEVVRTMDGDTSVPNPHPYPHGHVVGWSEALHMAVEAFYADLTETPATGLRRVPIADGVRSMKVLEAVFTSLTSRGWVDLDPT